MNALARFGPAAVLVLGGIAAYVWTTQDHPAAAPAVTPAAPAPAAKAPTPAPVVVQKAPAVPKPADTRAPLLYFPDGTSKPLLNGVTSPTTASWPNDRPFAKVKEIVRAGDVEWYLHEDGTQTTTVVRRDTISGKDVEIALYAVPEPLRAPTSLQGTKPPGR